MWFLLSLKEFRKLFASKLPELGLDFELFLYEVVKASNNDNS